MLRVVNLQNFQVVAYFCVYHITGNHKHTKHDDTSQPYEPFMCSSQNFTCDPHSISKYASDILGGCVVITGGAYVIAYQK